MCVSTHLNPGFIFPISSVLVSLLLIPRKQHRRYIFPFQLLLPKFSLCLLINFVCLVNRLRNLNPKLTFFSPVFCFNLLDHLVSFVNKFVHPPFKGEFILYVASYCLSSEFNRVRGFEILQRYPAEDYILPLNF